MHHQLQSKHNAANTLAEKSNLHRMAPAASVQITLIDTRPVVGDTPPLGTASSDATLLSTALIHSLTHTPHSHREQRMLNPTKPAFTIPKASLQNSILIISSTHIKLSQNGYIRRRLRPRLPRRHPPHMHINLTLLISLNLIHLNLILPIILITTTAFPRRDLLHRNRPRRHTMARQQNHSR